MKKQNPENCKHLSTSKEYFWNPVTKTFMQTGDLICNDCGETFAKKLQK